MRLFNTLSSSAIFCCAFTSLVSAANMVPLGSGVDARFGSQSNTYTDSDPTGLLWTAPGVGTYSPGSALPGLPGAPAPLQYPITFGNPFQNGGPGWTSNFVDTLAGTTSYAAATSNIADTFNPVPTMVQDAQVTVPALRLAQGPSAPGYAFIQLNFSADYGVTNNTTGLLGSTPNFPLTANGDIKGAGSYAQLDAQFNYSWTPVNSSLTPTGPTISLGTLTFQTTQTTPGLFVFPLTSSGTLSAAPTGDGILEINGYIYLAGDPSEIGISLPEPVSLSILGLGTIVLLRRKLKN